VHAFAQSSLGTWFMVFLAIVLAVCVLTYIFKRNHLKSEQRIESLVSRESSFLFNNLVLLTACFVILWGTLFPILSEFVEGSKITVARHSLTAWPFLLGSFCSSSQASARCCHGEQLRCRRFDATFFFPRSLFGQP